MLRRFLRFLDSARNDIFIPMASTIVRIVAAGKGWYRIVVAEVVIDKCGVSGTNADDGPRNDHSPTATRKPCEGVAGSLAVFGP